MLWSGGPLSGTKSFFKNPEQDRQYQRNDNTRGQGKIEFEIFRLEDKVAWQMAQVQFLQQWPADAKKNENNACDDQYLCHDLMLRK